MKILVLGVTGMLGNMVFTRFHETSRWEVWGTLRAKNDLDYFPETSHEKLITNVDVLDEEALNCVFSKVQPEVVVNCVGVIKQLASSQDPLVVLPINAMLPHRLLKHCKAYGARLIHIGTDCVFSGRKGFYSETDSSDAEDLYGKSKFMGEVIDEPCAITLRTSIIGHELHSHHGLLDWFLHQKEEVKGYRHAIFSGLTTYELAHLMIDVVIPNPTLKGLYHVAASPINKYELLQEIARQYGKKINIVPDDALKIDRSLNPKRFFEATGYQAPSWPHMIADLYQHRGPHVSW